MAPVGSSPSMAPSGMTIRLQLAPGDELDGVGIGPRLSAKARTRWLAPSLRASKTGAVMSLASICCMIRRETDHNAGPGRGNPAATSPLITRAPPLPSAPSAVTRRSTVEPPNIADVLAQIPPGSITCVRLDLLHWTAMRPSQMGRLRAEDFRLDEPIPYVAVPRGKGSRIAAVPLVPEGVTAAHAFRETLELTLPGDPPLVAESPLQTGRLGRCRRTVDGQSRQTGEKHIWPYPSLQPSGCTRCTRTSCDGR